MTPVPETLARVADLMSAFRPKWSLCGGWAADAWLGRQTRDHADIDIAVFHITSYGIKSALKKALKRGVQIRIVTDQGQSEDIHSVIGLLMEDGFAVKLFKGKGRNGLMHNKFAVFDHKLLLTGSYNWTETAEHYSYENVLFLPEKSLIKEYEKEFDLFWAKA